MTRKERINNQKRQERLFAIKMKQQGPQFTTFSIHDPIFGCAAKPFVPHILDVVKMIRRRVCYRGTLKRLRSFCDIPQHIIRQETRKHVKEYLRESGRKEWSVLETI